MPDPYGHGDTRPALLLYSLEALQSLIGPLIRAIGPHSICEIGVEKGLFTQFLLECCRESQATYLGIDPWLKGKRPPAHSGVEARWITQKSLDALPNLPPQDIYIIDGDHNYYTVFNELRIILGASATTKPFIFFHDVAWPWARRDVYYNPAAIPDEFRHSHSHELGPVPGESALQVWGFSGVTSEINHASAEREGGPRNGVLSAIEDAVKEFSLHDWRFIRIPVIFGLGLLFHPPSLPKSALTLLDDTDRGARVLKEVLETMEANRLRLFLEYLRGIRIHDRRVEAFHTLQEHVSHLECHLQKLQDSYESLEKYSAELELAAERFTLQEVSFRDLKTSFENLQESHRSINEHHALLLQENAKLLATNQELGLRFDDLHDRWNHLNAFSEESVAAFNGLNAYASFLKGETDKLNHQVRTVTEARDQYHDRLTHLETLVEDVAARAIDVFRPESEEKKAETEPGIWRSRFLLLRHHRHRLNSIRELPAIADRCPIVSFSPWDMLLRLPDEAALNKVKVQVCGLLSDWLTEHSRTVPASIIRLLQRTVEYELRSRRRSTGQGAPPALSAIIQRLLAAVTGEDPDESVVGHFCRLELDEVSRACAPCKDALSVVKALKAAKKRIYLVGQATFNSADLQAIYLEHEQNLDQYIDGYHIGAAGTPSEIGTIDFLRLAEAEQVGPSDWCHVGPSLQLDCALPRSFGIRGYWLSS